MPTYVSLIRFTSQGLQNIHESPHRAQAFKAAARKAGIKVSQIFWTMGTYDGVILFDAPNEGVATGLMLALDALGNVQTTTLRAFSADEFAKIIGAAPKL